MRDSVVTSPFGSGAHGCATPVTTSSEARFERSTPPKLANAPPTNTSCGAGSTTYTSPPTGTAGAWAAPLPNTLTTAYFSRRCPPMCVKLPPRYTLNSSNPIAFTRPLTPGFHDVATPVAVSIAAIP